jgi:hypothetical protein
LVNSVPSMQSLPALGGEVASENTCDNAARFRSMSLRAYLDLYRIAGRAIHIG